VTSPFIALVLRESGGESERQNHFWDEHVDNRDASVAGVVDWWEDPSGGTNPGGPWPPNGAGPERLIPFTGYIELAVSADGRAVDAAGNAVTLAIDPGAMLDLRVDVQFCLGCLDNADDAWQQQKYLTEDDDVTLVGWQEMILIQAEAAGTDAEAIVLINVLRSAAGLPLVTYNPAGDEIENMIIEERRRQLFLEGRFWAAKIRNQQPGTTKLWFPRELEDQGEQDPNDNTLQGGVRQRMNNDEFDLNILLSRSDRASLCIDEQKPVNPNVL
jgi:hypothetical protein